MRRDLREFEANEFDVVVVGGGIFGAFAAWDATLRGLTVALIERRDFCSGSSANSYKIVHGGIRYLQHGDIVRARASCAERSAFLRIAPHLVAPLPIVVPTYGNGRSGKAFLRTGTFAYDALTADRNRYINDQARMIPSSFTLGAAEVMEAFPYLQNAGLTGAVVFHDGQMYNPTRLVISVMRSASAVGAVLANYVEARNIIVESGRVSAVEAHDELTDTSFRIRTRTVINAAGPWSERIEQKLGRTPSTVFSRDACFVTRRQPHDRYALAVPAATNDPDAVLSRGARHLFVAPWRQRYSLIGTWHRIHDNPDAATVSNAELEQFVQEINESCPELALRLEDVSMWNAGLVPFGDNDPQAVDLSYGKRSIVTDHSQFGVRGLVTVIGIRYTMARCDSQRAVDCAVAALPHQPRRCTTHEHAVFGGDFATFKALASEISRSEPELPAAVCKALAHNYGSEYQRILEGAREKPHLRAVVPNSTVLAAELRSSIREEMPQHLTDLIMRRTDIATGEDPGEQALHLCAEIMGEELDWNTAKREREILGARQALQVPAPLPASSAVVG